MKVKINTGYKNSVKNKPIKLILDLPTLDILCRYIISSSELVRMKHLVNLRKLIFALDPSTYENDPEKKKRMDFLFKATEARLDYHLKDRTMILTHVNGGLTYELDFIDYNAPELDKNELSWVAQLISESIQYQFLYERLDQLQDLITQFNTSNFLNRGNIVKEFEHTIDMIKNDFRHSKVETGTNDMMFSLKEGVFENVVTDIYNKVTSPSHRLITGMIGFNELIGGGFEAERVYMLFGTSGVGKSLTLLNLLTQIKKYNCNYQTKDPTKTPCVVLLTMENTMVDTIVRLFAMANDGAGSMIDYSIDEVLDILRNKGELKVTDNSPIDIIIKFRPNKSEDTSYLYTLCEDLSDEGYEVIALIQDHVKRIRSVYGSSDLRIELGDIVNEMKVFAGDLGIPVISVSHLNRDANKILEDAAAKGANIDVTLKLGVSNVGESVLMIDNLDVGVIINLDFDQDGNRYLCYNLIKMRDNPIRTYIAQPFMYGSTIRLIEDVGGVPMFKEYLHMAPGIQRNASVVTRSANTIMNIENITDDTFDNSFTDAGDRLTDLRIYNRDDYDVDPPQPKKPESPIVYFDKPDMYVAELIKEKIQLQLKMMQVPKDISISA